MATRPRTLFVMPDEGDESGRYVIREQFDEPDAEPAAPPKKRRRRSKKPAEPPPFTLESHPAVAGGDLAYSFADWAVTDEPPISKRVDTIESASEKIAELRADLSNCRRLSRRADVPLPEDFVRGVTNKIRRTQNVERKNRTAINRAWNSNNAAKRGSNPSRKKIARAH